MKPCHLPLWVLCAISAFIQFNEDYIDVCPFLVRHLLVLILSCLQLQLSLPLGAGARS